MIVVSVVFEYVILDFPCLIFKTNFFFTLENCIWRKFVNILSLFFVFVSF